VRIAIDARKLHDFGIGTYVRNLLRALARRSDDLDYTLLCRPEDVEYAEALGPRFRPLSVEAGNYSVSELVTVPTALARVRPHLFHAPHYVVSPFTPCPFVVTIHDCIHLRFPEYLPNRLAPIYARVMMRQSARRARRVLTVSDASKQDIVRYLNVAPAKVDVVYNALDERLALAPTDVELARVRDRYQLEAPFILYAGNIKPHKNIDRLIEAYAILRRRGRTNVQLLLIGDQLSKYPNLRRLVHRFDLHGHVRFFGFVSDDVLAALYRLASIFVFPSLYEGFGLPPLEAMAAGTPVVTANVSSLPEVVGDAALLIDPMDAGAIADAMTRLFDDDALRHALVARGRQRVADFSWDRSAASVRDVYVACGSARRE
jgi:glycosyltransferase involved in cell wall biosynthesis